MVGVNDIVITGIGCVTPMGIGRDAYYRALLGRKCAIRRLFTLSDAQRTTYYGASVDDFDGKLYVTPRKSLKVMGREVQIAYSAAHLAWQDAGLHNAAPHPERIGVCYGSEMIPGEIEDLSGAIMASVEEGEMNFGKWGTTFPKHIFPLWMLKYLPNMPACHVAIAVNARGPNNSIAQEEASSLLALGEAASIIERGAADLMLVGAAGARVTPTRMIYRAPELYDQHPYDKARADGPRSMPFDSRRQGIISSEGAAAFVLESRRHAMQRGGKILGVLTGYSSRCGRPTSQYSGSRRALASAAADAMEQSEVTREMLAHVSAQGFSGSKLDAEEAAAIACVADGVPVTAFSSYFGTAGAASGLLELAASMLAVLDNRTLPTLGTEQIATDCPINVVTVGSEAQHSSSARLTANQEHILKLSFTPHGHAAAVVVQCMK